MNEMSAFSDAEPRESAIALRQQVLTLEAAFAEQRLRNRSNALFGLLLAMALLVAVLVAWLCRLLGLAVDRIVAVGLPAALIVLILAGSLTALAAYQEMREAEHARRLFARSAELQRKLAERKPDPKPS